MPYEDTEKEEVKFDTEPKFDIEKASQLLDVMHDSKDESNLRPLFDDAYRTLCAMAAELTAKIAKERKEMEDEGR